MLSTAAGLTAAEVAERVLAHIRGRTRMGRFACQPHYLSSDEWERALRDIEAQGHEIRFVYGQVLDDPSVTGGWVIDE